MRICNGPRLVVPRAGITRRRWGYYGKNPGYERFLAEQWERIRRIPHRTAGDAKSQAVWLSSLKPGEHYRMVDGHGRTTGPRLTACADDRMWGSHTLVRRVERQPEDYHSRLSRMLKRAHRISVTED